MANSGGPGDQSALPFFHKIHCGTLDTAQQKFSTDFNLISHFERT